MEYFTIVCIYCKLKSVPHKGKSEYVSFYSYLPLGEIVVKGKSNDCGQTCVSYPNREISKAIYITFLSQIHLKNGRNPTKPSSLSA